MNDQRRYGSELDNTRRQRGGEDPLAELARLVSEDDTAGARDYHQPQRGHDPHGRGPRIDHAPQHHDYAHDEAAFFGGSDPRGHQQGDEFDFQETDEEYYARTAQYAPAQGDYYASHEMEEPAPRRRKGVFTVIAVLALVVIGGLGAVAYSLFGGGDDDVADSGGLPPVIQASRDPAKTAPEGQSNEIPHQNKMIYDRVGSEPTGSGNVVGGAEEPGERPFGASAPEDVASGETQTGLEPVPLATENTGPRRVRTIAIRPDGSIASPEPASANEAAAVEPPAEEDTGPIVGTGPVAGGMSMERGSEFGIMTSEGANQAASPSSAALVPVPLARPNDLLSRVQTQPAPSAPTGIVTAPSSAPPPAAAPPSAPAGSNVAVPANQTTTKKRELRPPPIPANQQRPAAQRSSLVPSAATPAGSYSVQLSAQSSESVARSEFTSLQRRYPSLLGGRQPSIQPVSIPERGTFYRVRVNTGSQVEAANLCNNLKAAGGDCLVQRN
jgi:hypothetical protein